MDTLAMNEGIVFSDLYCDDGYEKLKRIFMERVKRKDARLHKLWLEHEAKYDILNACSDGSAKKYAADIAKSAEDFLDKAKATEILIALAIELEDFLLHIFDVEIQHETIKLKAQQYRDLFDFHQKIVRRRLQALSDDMSLDDATKILDERGIEWRGDVVMFEREFYAVLSKLTLSENDDIWRAAGVYAAWARKSDRHKHGWLFHLPLRIKWEMLMQDVEIDENKHFVRKNVERSDFSHSDIYKTEHKSYFHTNYCLYCHSRDKDTCSSGIKEGAAFTRNPLQNVLTGCPLDQKISEMNMLRAKGHTLAALIVAMIDNPLIIGTGHRICNDCEKACIYQQQEPVDIPMIETQIIDDILDLDWGFEIYSLLTRWNPVDIMRVQSFNYSARYSVQKDSTVLIVGLGPSGFTLAHYLLNAGVSVVAIDGMKIEPLSANISGIDASGKRSEFLPIKDVKQLYDALPANQGFGGVMEYGITARWNKKYLGIIRLLLERRENFRMYGSVRFGDDGIFSIQDAKSRGFDHVALAMGAGKPRILQQWRSIGARGVRMAADFLMALHLGDSRFEGGVMSMQIRLPVIIVGGGLTAIDAATEALTYYIMQIRKFAEHCARFGYDFLDSLSQEEKEAALEFLSHERELRTSSEEQRILLKRWGGAKILYRGKMAESAAYRLNHKELQYALNEGVEFIERHNFIDVIEINGSCAGVRCENASGEGVNLVAKSVLIAIGVNKRDANDRKMIFADTALSDEWRLSDKNFSINEYVTVFGDMHPNYCGSVVKAMASAKHGVSHILRKLKHNLKSEQRCDEALVKFNSIVNDLNDCFISKIVSIRRLNDDDTVFEMRVKANALAQKFRAGNIFRFQNYRAISHIKQIEPIPLTGAKIDREIGEIAFVISGVGASTKLVQHLKSGEIISLMGPTGKALNLRSCEKVMLIANKMSGYLLIPVIQHLKSSECSVICFGDRQYVEESYAKEIEMLADFVVWRRDNDMEQKGERDIMKNGSAMYIKCSNHLEALALYAHGIKCGDQSGFDINGTSRVILLGGPDMMRSFAAALVSELSDEEVVGYDDAHRCDDDVVKYRAGMEYVRSILRRNVDIVGTSNVSMQCMMKGICGQCICKKHDSADGAEGYMFACANHYVNISEVDWVNMKNRSEQNRLFEKVAMMQLEEWS